MNIKFIGPVFVPYEFQPELAAMSKAALMDMVWDYAEQMAGGPATGPDATMLEFRSRREIILAYRDKA
jgi:hypothetical protein